MTASRTRNWVCIVWPESAPENWKQLLSDLCVPAYVSPLHDKDINPTGEPKKAHYHVILQFAGVKSRDQVLDICNKFGGVNPGPCDNIQGYARYLIHMDNPEKYQYDSQEIETFAGADWSSLIRTSKDRYNTLSEIVRFINEKHIRYYHDLVSWCDKNNREWFEVCMDNTIVLKAYCVSVATKYKEVGLHGYPDNGLSKIPVEFDSSDE